MRFDRCNVDDSTRSLPSTLLKKSERRNFVPYHERVIPPPVAELSLTKNIRNDARSIDLSSVSTQSTPFSQDLRDPPSRDAAKERRREMNVPAMNQESSLHQQPEYTAEYKSRRMRGKNRNTYRRQTSPEWHTRQMKPATLSTQQTLCKARSASNQSPKECPKTLVDKISEHLEDGRDEEVHLSLRNIVSRITNNSSASEDVVSNSSAKSLSSREREIKGAAANASSQRSPEGEEASHAASASHKSETPGLTIPTTSSLDALCSTYDDDGQDGEDDDDRLIITVSTSMASKVTTRARGSGPTKDSFRRMDSLVERSSSLECSTSRVSGPGSQHSVDGWENVQESGQSIWSKESSVYSHDIRDAGLLSMVSEKESMASKSSRKSNGSYATNSQKSIPRTDRSNQKTFDVEDQKFCKDDETFLEKEDTQNKGGDISKHSNWDTASNARPASIARSKTKDAAGETASRSASIARSKGQDAVGAMISLRSRDIDISKHSNGDTASNARPASIARSKTKNAVGETASRSTSIARSKGQDAVGEMISLRSQEIDISKHSNWDTASNARPASIARSKTKDATGETVSNLQSVSIARSKRKEAVGEMISLRSRENDILSAAASRKSGRPPSCRREVLIEEYEKPVFTKSEGAIVGNGSGSNAWKKIDSVLFSDDQSELKLFRTPINDVAFDDFLTTTSSCSSISASQDPSGYIVNTSSHAQLRPNFVPVRSVIQFDRVKSVLDRMRAPNTRAYHNGMVVQGPSRMRPPPFMASKPFPKLPGRPTPQPQIVHGRHIPCKPTVDDVASARGVPVVSAMSFYGEVKGVPLEGVEFQRAQVETVPKVIGLSPKRAPQDPPVNVVGNTQATVDAVDVRVDSS